MWSPSCGYPWLLVDRWPRDFEDDRGAGWTLVGGVGVETDLSFEGALADAELDPASPLAAAVALLEPTEAFRLWLPLDGTGVLRPRSGWSTSTKEGSKGRVLSTAAGGCDNSTGITAVEVVAVVLRSSS